MHNYYSRKVKKFHIPVRMLPSMLTNGDVFSGFENAIEIADYSSCWYESLTVQYKFVLGTIRFSYSFFYFSGVLSMSIKYARAILWAEPYWASF